MYACILCFLVRFSSRRYFRSRPEPFYHLARKLWPGKYRPTATHHFIRQLHEHGILLRCYTQNIDSLETQAGLPKEKLVAVHGGFDEAYCIETGADVPVEELRAALMQCEGSGSDQPGSDWRALREKYGGLVKPRIVFFGEDLPRRFHKLQLRDFRECDLLLVMGTSLQVDPFASLIGHRDLAQNVPRVLFNRERVGEASRFWCVVFVSEPICAAGSCLTPVRVPSRSCLRPLLRTLRQPGGYGFQFDVWPWTRPRDIFVQGDCDSSVLRLTKSLGWASELTNADTAAAKAVH